MRVENVRVNVLKPVRVDVMDESGEVSTLHPSNDSLVVFRVLKDSRDLMKQFSGWLAQKPKWREIPIAIDLRKWYRKKTLDQLALFWSLVRVLTLESEGKDDKEIKTQLYHGLLHLYAPKVEGRLPDGSKAGESVKTLSEMNTLEAARLIEGTFRELVLMGVSVDNSSKLRNWYAEWRDWRGRAKAADLEQTYRDLEDYKERVPYCEATLTPLHEGGGSLAHIVSRGAGGENFEPWNFLHLRDDIHLQVQHTKGWVELLQQYPHLIHKVNYARERLGYKTITRPEDLWDDLIAVHEEQDDSRQRGLDETQNPQGDMEIF